MFAAAVFIGNAAAAHAAIIEQIYKGNVVAINEHSLSSFDIGAPVTATFYFDTSRGYFENEGVDVRIEGGVNGAPVAPTPALGASIDVGGTTYNFDGAYYAELFSSLNETFANEVSGLDPITGSQNWVYGQVVGVPNAFGLSLVQSYLYAGPFLSSTVGHFDFTVDEPITGGAIPLRDAGSYSIYSVQEIAGIPEPATWATLLLGLFGVGAMLRATRGDRLPRTLSESRLPPTTKGHGKSRILCRLRR